MFRKLAVLLLICFTFMTVHAQTDLGFAENDFVLITISRLPVYTQADNSSTVAAEMLRGMRSRVLDIAEIANGTTWVYLEDMAYGWVPTMLNGEPTMILYTPQAISQMLQSAQELVDTKPSEPESYIWRGTVNLTLNEDPYLATADFSAAVSIAPDNPAYLEMYGRALFNTNEYALALDNIEQAIELGRQYANTYNRAAIAYEGLGYYEEAIDYFEQALEVAPDYGILTGNIGNQYYNLGDYETSMDYYEQGLVIDPHLTYLYAYIGDIYTIYGEYERAMQEYNAGLDADPFCYECLRFRGGLYAQHYGDAESALADLTQATHIDPYSEYGFMDLGVLQMQLGDFDAAIVSFKTAAALNPLNDLTFYNLGTVYGLHGDYEKALENYDRVVELASSESHSVLLYRAQIYIALEDYENAIEDANTYVSELDDTADAMYFRATAHIELAAAYAYTGEYDRAQRRLEQALDAANDFVINYEVYGEGYWVTPLRLEEAYDLVAQYESGTRNADTALQIANLFFEYGSWEVAHSYYQSYIALGGDSSSDLEDFIDYLETLY